MTAQLEALTNYTVDLELSCDECGGSGFDPGGIDPWGPEPCPACRGAGTQRIAKNYLAEALRIAARSRMPAADRTRPLGRNRPILPASSQCSHGPT